MHAGALRGGVIAAGCQGWNVPPCKRRRGPGAAPHTAQACCALVPKSTCFVSMSDVSECMHVRQPCCMDAMQFPACCVLWGRCILLRLTEVAGRVVQEKCVACLRDIARGMEYIQSKKVIHGDLKPSNVLFRSAASGGATRTASQPLSDTGRATTGAAHTETSEEADPYHQMPLQESARAATAGSASRISNRALFP